MESGINISGGNNIIATSATEATMNTSSGVSPTEPQPAMTGTYRHFVTHDAVGVPQIIARARRHIVFHAAFYPKYGNDDQGRYVEEAMVKNSDLILTAVFTDFKHVTWADEFTHILRPGFTAKEFMLQLRASRQYFTKWRKAFGPRRVHIYNTSRLPMFPVILIDDTLIIGHYAHSSIIAPHGLWLTVQHPRIPAMYDSLLAHRQADCTTLEERAIVRYLEELTFISK